tara:strand:+ start:11944 stop:12165 length:222 start_codon:yes stop_codon:yes gene_type:complete
MKVTAYKAEDGTLFETESEAVHHNKGIGMDKLFNKFYEDNSCYGQIRIDSLRELKEIVGENKDLFGWVLEGSK